LEQSFFVRSYVRRMKVCGKESQFQSSWLVTSDPHDLGALQPKAGHQTLLIKNESVDAFMHGLWSNAFPSRNSQPR
jgi:hypothetical protein